jgi:hypothetical protein
MAIYLCNIPNFLDFFGCLYVQVYHHFLGQAVPHFATLMDTVAYHYCTVRS